MRVWTKDSSSGVFFAVIALYAEAIFVAQLVVPYQHERLFREPITL